MTDVKQRKQMLARQISVNKGAPHSCEGIKMTRKDRVTIYHGFNYGVHLDPVIRLFFY